ncbi:MAG: septum formation initiator family protein [Flavobacteriales bacterium]|nr:septum formation initiator family protein [Flavobacteriales bacterium]|tara:strand:- start:1033 stop:1347 length:315 start_codon:yes stop_codon:yes gene_type:complete
MTHLKNLYEKIPSYLKNKYVIIISLFIIWIVFFDNYNLIRQSKIKKEIKQLEENKNFYSKEIKKDSTEYHELLNSDEKKEKFAREKFLMRKENEDVYIIRKKND